MEKMLSDWPEAYNHQSLKFEKIAGRPFSIDYIQNRNEILGKIEGYLRTDSKGSCL